MTLSKPIGKRGEDFVTRVSARFFLSDFVYSNPEYYERHLRRELCDAAISFDKHLLVVQIKTADPDAHASFDAGKKQRWRRKQTAKAARQIDGAVAALQRGQIASATDRRGDSFAVNASEYEHVWGVVIIDHNHERPADVEWEELGAEVRTPTLFLTFHEFLSLAADLSTIGDLFDYLHFRLLQCQSVIFSGSSELDLLGMFRQRRNTFEDRSRHYDMVVVEDGIWQQYLRHPQVVDRDRRSTTSYIVDSLISRMHEAVEYGDPRDVDFDTLADGKYPKSTQYRTIVQELARFRRTERLHIGERIVEKSRLYETTKRPRWFVLNYPDRVPLLVIVDGSNRPDRAAFLGKLAPLAKLQAECQRLIAISFSPLASATTSLDAAYLDSDPAKDRSSAKASDLALLPELFAGATHVTTNEYRNDILCPPRRRSFKQRVRKSR